MHDSQLPDSDTMSSAAPVRQNITAARLALPTATRRARRGDTGSSSTVRDDSQLPDGNMTSSAWRHGQQQHSAARRYRPTATRRAAL